MKAIAVLIMSLALSGCAATSAIKAVAGVAGLGGDTPDVTAQVGRENTKQGIGLANKSETKTTTEVGDVSGAAVVTQTTTRKQGQVETGTVTATNLKVTTSNPWPLIAAMGIGMLSLLSIIFWFIPSPFRKKEA